MNRVYFKNTLVLLGPGYRGSFGVFLPGGAYKSKSALFSGAAAFHLPTVSPLKASYIFGLRMVRILFLITPQREFDKAIGWWLETGIYSKMESDVGRNRNWTTEWKRPTTNPKESLEVGHVLPLFIIFVAAIMFSTVVFGIELLSLRYSTMRQKASVITTHIERRMEGAIIRGKKNQLQKAFHRTIAADGMPEIA